MNKNTLLLSVFSFCLFCGCGDDNDGIPEWPWTDPTEEPTPPPEEPVEANPAIVAAGWTNVNASFGTREKGGCLHRRCRYGKGRKV